MKEPRVPALLVEHHQPGFYFRVLEAGEVEAGDDHRSDPIWNHYRAFKWWLLPHGVAGACTLVLAPMQFADRQHRQWMTRSYAVAIVFLESRVIVGLAGWGHNIGIAETVSWTTLALSPVRRHSDPVT